MSKRLGNVVDPMEVIEETGADALRWYFCVKNPEVNSRFSARLVESLPKPAGLHVFARGIAEAGDDGRLTVRPTRRAIRSAPPRSTTTSGSAGRRRATPM